MIVRQWALLVAVAVATANAAASPAIPRDRPVSFEMNRGQADWQVRFLTRGPGYTAFLTAGEAVLALDGGGGEPSVVRVKPVGANPAARIVGDGELPGVVRYVLPVASTPPVSASTYAGVRYVDVYPGIDLVYHGRARRLEYDFVVGAGADPGAIVLAFDGVDRVAVDGDGALVAHTRAGDLRQPRPVVYQEIDGVRHDVAGDYVVDAAGQVRFRLGGYDRSKPLVIDPPLVYSTYLGGTGDESDAPYEGGTRIGVDAAGNLYVAGTTRSADFPTTPGLGVAAGKRDMFVTKLAPGGGLVYSTYLGGACDDFLRDVAVDAEGNAYITGRVFDGNFCDAGVPPGAFVAKLDPTGALLFASLLAGSEGDNSVGQAITVDADGHAYVTGEAVSTSNDFPTTPGAFRETECANDFPLAGDVFVAKLTTDGHALLYSTIICGKGNDSPHGIAVDDAGIAHVAGETLSPDFPTVHPMQAAPGAPDTVTGFVVAVAPDGSDLLYSTYLGGSDRDWIQGIAVDALGTAYVTGETSSPDFPTTTGVLQEHPGPRLCPERCTDAFVAKIDPTGAGLIYSTYLTGERSDHASAIAIDAAGNAYVTGNTNSEFFPILDAFQPAIQSATDAFVAKLNPDGTRLLYSSYLGGNHTDGVPRTGWETATGIAVDAGGSAYVAGYTQSFDFPTTPDAFQPEMAGGICDRALGIPCGDAFATKIAAGGPGVVTPVTVDATPAVPAAGSTLTVTWAGIETPHPKDSLQLYPLGAPYGDSAIAAFRFTGATSAGTLPLDLPAGIAPGWYELRLVNTAGGAKVVARTPPIRITAAGPTTSTTVPDSPPPPTTTIPGTTDPGTPHGPTSICGDGCDDGDPCTVDTCVRNAGCASRPAEGLASVTCTCERPAPAACAADTVPAAIGRRQGRACGLFSGAAGPSSAKRLRRAMATLGGSIAVVSKAQKKGKLSADCAGALRAELLDAKDRAAGLVATLASGRR
jgi:Beta-propeller repeat